MVRWVYDNYRHRARSAAAGARAGTAAWAGGRRGASRRAATVPLAVCPGRADGSAPATCRTGATPTVTASTMPMSPAIATQARGPGLACDKPASVRPRPGRGPGRGRDLPPGVICDSGRRHRRWWRRNCCRSGQGTGRRPAPTLNIVPQTVPQPALPAARPRRCPAARQDPWRQAASPGRSHQPAPTRAAAALGGPGARTLVRRLAHEGWHPGQTFVSDHSQRIQITSRHGLSPAIRSGARYSAVPATIPVTGPGTKPTAREMPRIRDLHRSARGKHEVPRLDITVDQAHGVRRLHGRPRPAQRRPWSARHPRDRRPARQPERARRTSSITRIRLRPSAARRSHRCARCSRAATPRRAAPRPGTGPGLLAAEHKRDAAA